MEATTVGFRWIGHQGNDELFVVGTKADYDRFEHELFPDRPAEDRSSGKNNGGKRSGGRGMKGH
jgi:hypothetical protein